MTMTKVFPIIMIVLQVCAAAVFIYKGKWPFAWYWLSGASIAFSTLFMK